MVLFLHEPLERKDLMVFEMGTLETVIRPGEPDWSLHDILVNIPPAPGPSIYGPGYGTDLQTDGFGHSQRQAIRSGNLLITAMKSWR